MPSPRRAPVSRWRSPTALLSIAVLVVGLPGAATGAVPPKPDAQGIEAGQRDWRWPLDGFRITEHYVQPAHPYGTGHRGIDLSPVGAATVMTPASGVVAFSGQVAGRGILTIDHGDGLVTTLEPVTSELGPGDPVERGDVVATITVGGHSRPGELHFGVRRDGEYINPLLLLGGVPRAVLLPCCGAVG
ncbi:murein hydrolase activator EnvC [Microbacterium sp. RU33B]|uniref:murein hydrolase activator EnvC family protein n=1 Tax=Microbacterium sp. RU33B TaxID=1907390 RepID=UPI000965F6E4|nr:M23 family metallopeptidase [Microbacterium sp. RU33B]SIT73295.1 Peptidase family M23 [Microbacterium sp. RU33B]